MYGISLCMGIRFMTRWVSWKLDGGNCYLFSLIQNQGILSFSIVFSNSVCSYHIVQGHFKICQWRLPPFISYSKAGNFIFFCSCHVVYWQFSNFAIYKFWIKAVVDLKIWIVLINHDGWRRINVNQWGHRLCSVSQYFHLLSNLAFKLEVKCWASVFSFPRSQKRNDDCFVGRLELSCNSAELIHDYNTSKSVT